jgi:energy-coupling factor transporter transmembrane protein EcfT
VEGVSLEMAKSDKGRHQTLLHCLYCLILLAGIILFIVIFVVFNDDFFYLVTIFVVLLVGAQVTDKAISGTRHLPDQ